MFWDSAIKEILSVIVFKFLNLEIVASLTANILSERNNTKCYSKLWASKLMQLLLDVSSQHLEFIRVTSQYLW